MGNLCPICKGSGNILTMTRGFQWWTCLCGGSGVLVQHGPTHHHLARKKARKL